jgi:hypothetical protein
MIQDPPIVSLICVCATSTAHSEPLRGWLPPSQDSLEQVGHIVDSSGLAPVFSPYPLTSGAQPRSLLRVIVAYLRRQASFLLNQFSPAGLMTSSAKVSSRATAPCSTPDGMWRTSSMRSTNSLLGSCSFRTHLTVHVIRFLRSLFCPVLIVATKPAQRSFEFLVGSLFAVLFSGIRAIGHSVWADLVNRFLQGQEIIRRPSIWSNYSFMLF